MRFTGWIERDPNNGMWAIGCDDLAAATQGATREEAFRMFKSYFAELFEKPAAGEIRIDETTKDEFSFEFTAEKELFFDLLKRLKFGAAVKNRELAERMGIEQQGSISRYLTGTREPSATTFLSLLDAMGYDISIRKRA